jgi:hypothetical protein
VIRQGKQVHIEAPFLYLLLGTDCSAPRRRCSTTRATAEAERSPIRRTDPANRR